MRPFHHGDDAGATGNWLQRFNDSDAGVLLAGVLHSVGALLFAGGIVLYLYVAHALRKEGAPRGRIPLLAYAHAFTLSGVALNGVGGVMRLYESDHPKLDRLADSTWVQVLLVKHLFLIAGVALAVALAWRTRVLARSPEEPAVYRRSASRLTWYAAASLSTILLAAVLGAVANNVDLAADLGETPALAGMDDHGHAEAQVLADSSVPGTITATPAQPAQQSTSVFVAGEADRIVAVLRWTSNETGGVSPVDLGLLIRDPNGKDVPGTTMRGDRTLGITVAGASVIEGDWRFIVTATRAFAERYTLHVTVLHSAGAGNLINRTVTVAPGEFFEANLLMGSGSSIEFEWTILNSTTRKVHFDVHRHPEGRDPEYPVQGEFNAYRGNYTHPGGTQGPSLLWENGGTDDVAIRMRITGDFTVHSYHPA